MKKLLLLCVVPMLIANFGCSRSFRPAPAKRPPRSIDWQDPHSVMRGFLAAKKRGDWRTAYDCCDYDYTLTKEERASIKKKWKEECKKWPLDYMYTFWQLSAPDFRDGDAAIRILVSRRNPITGELRPGEVYHEVLKKYKDKWKITSPLVATPPSTAPEK